MQQVGTQRNRSLRLLHTASRPVAEQQHVLQWREAGQAACAAGDVVCSVSSSLSGQRPGGEGVIDLNEAKDVLAY